jgi:hypothetical protein
MALCCLAAPLHAQSSGNGNDITFDPAITAADFQKFSHLIAQGVYASPVQPARSSGFLNFDVGIAATAVKVDTKAAYWRRAVNANNDFSTHGYVGIPRLVVSKGFSSGTISASYAKVNDSGIKTYGGALDVPIVRGSLATPELAARGTYTTVTGSDFYKLKVYGVEAFLSKGFGPIMPYAAAGRMRVDAKGIIPPTSVTPQINLTDKSDVNRYTVGVRISMFIPKLVVEATKAEVMSYSAKVSIGW